jgi:hypothetical protein
MSQQIFHFDNYVVRPIAETDRVYLDSLIEADGYHKDRMSADYFLSLLPGEDAWAMEDEQGNVLFYFKTQTAVRLSLQFTQGETPEEKTRNRVGLLKGMAWIEGMLRQNHFREILFQTDGPQLTAMAKRRMGFRESSGELVREITPPQPLGRDTGNWGTVPQHARGEG